MSAYKDPKNYVPFWRFFSEVYCQMLSLSIPLKPAHKAVCDALEAAYLGESCGKTFIVINIAPRIGKTKMLEALMCWGMAYFPDSHIINTSYSAPLAEASTRYVFGIMQSEWYRTLFPWVKMGDVQRGHEFNTTQGGRVYGTGVSGSLTGFGGGLKRPAGGCIIIDDPANPKDALSSATAQELQFWFENVILRRRNSSDHTPVIIVAQRLAVDDLPGYVLESYPNQTLHLKFPMVDEERKISLFPETVSFEAAMQTKRLNPFAFFAQMQQEPVVLGGNLIKITDLCFYKLSDSLKFSRKIITCDTAMKTKQSNDYSVLQCWGKLDNKVYLIDHVRGKWEAPELLDMYIKFYAMHHKPESSVHRATLEDRSSGITLAQQLKRAGIPVTPIQRSKDKVTRVQEILPFIAAHLVYLPQDVVWLNEVLSELAQFRADGKARHDDAVDAMCDGIFELLGKPLSIFDVLGGTKK